MKRLSFVLLILFILDFVIDVFIANTEYTPARYISKGLLMLLLLAFFLSEIRGYWNIANRKYIRLICSALVFSFAGDMFLVGESSLNFILGIGGFLLAQLCYVAFFYSVGSFGKKHFALLFMVALIIIGYLVILNYLFMPVVSEQQLTAPVLVYSLVLGLMLFTSVSVAFSARSRRMAVYFFIPGAVIFVSSDSMIAFNRFYLSTAIPGFYIMFTYCIAQLLIVKGASRLIKKNS